MMENSGLGVWGGFGSIAGKARLGVAAALCAIVAGCASDGAYVSGGASAAAGGAYAPGDRLFRNNHDETLYPREASRADAQAQEFAAYHGVEGARLAHRLYPTSYAEKFDGQCEPKIAVARGESLADIADYCDVSLFVLAQHNDLSANPDHVFDGGVLDIPHINSTVPGDLQRISYADGVDSLPLSPLPSGAGVHHVVSGDTLSGIARRHNVSAATLANLNPGVDWRRLAIGAELKLPKTASASRRVKKVSDAAHAQADAFLSVSSMTAKPGENVTVYAQGLAPLTEVTLYRGANWRSLKAAGTAITDEQGALTALVPAKADDLGGVIFAASVDGEMIYSPRVSVLRLTK